MPESPTDLPRRVVLVQRFLPRYRTAFYETLRALLAAQGVELVLVRSTPPGNPYGRGDAVDLAWAVEIPARAIELFGHSALWQPLPETARSADLVVVEQASQLLLNYLLLVRQLVLGKRFAFWGHGRSFDERASATGPGERVKAWVSRHAHWWFAYNDLAAAVVAELGFPEARMTVVRNSTDTRTLQRMVRALTPEILAATRREFALGPGPVGLFVGNFSVSKRFDFLFEACDELHRQDPDFSLLIVGQGPERQRVEASVAQRPYAHYVGNRFGAELARCFAVSDVLLIPGWAGLVVVDSFAAGVPVAASASFPHPPEISYVVSGENGLVVQDGGVASRYADRVHQLLHDPDEYARLVAGCETAAALYSTEAMAERFACGVLDALDAPA